jgi:hypothetical protein
MKSIQFRLRGLILLTTAVALLSNVLFIKAFQRRAMNAFRKTDSRLMESFRTINNKIDGGSDFETAVATTTLPFDGWGTRIVAIENEELHWIISAGPDREFHTNDDKRLLVPN